MSERDLANAIAEDAEQGWRGIGRVQVIVGAGGKPYLADARQRQLSRADLDEIARLWNSATGRSHRLAAFCTLCGSHECSGAFGFVCDRGVQP